MRFGAGTQLPRRRLSSLLDALGERRLLAVVADSGSGKTVAVADWVAGRPEPTVWVTLGPEHADPVRLLAALADATAHECPRLGEVLAPELASRSTPPPAAQTQVAAAPLAEALATGWGETMTAPFRLVLDDLHALTGTPGERFLIDLVRLYPRGMQLVVLGRERPAFGVERLRGAGEYGEIGQRALLFDVPETIALFAAFGVRLTPDEAGAVVTACAGWATAVRLALEQALTAGNAHLLGQLTSPTAAAERLTAAVLTPLAPGVRRVLRAMEVLGRVPTFLVDDSAGEVAAVDALAERGLLVTATGRSWQLTPLARYAIGLADPVDELTRADLLRRAVLAALEAGWDAGATGGGTATELAESAVGWALTLGDAAIVQEAVAGAGPHLMDALVIAPLVAAAQLLPVPVGNAGIDALFAQVFARRGELARALQHLDALGPDATLPAAVTWRVAGELWMQGESTRTAEVLARADTAGAASDLAIVEAGRATVAWGRGDGANGRVLADEALRLARACGDDAALGSAWVAQALVAVLEGDLERNRVAYTTALRHARAAGDARTQVRIHNNVGSQLVETGRYRAALDELAEAVRLGEAIGQTALVAMSRCNEGDARYGLGQLEQCLQSYDESLATWTAIESPMAAEALRGRADALARRGDTARAAASYRAAIELAERNDDAQALVPALAGLALVEHGEDADLAAQLVERVLAEPSSVGALPAYLSAGWIALCDGDRTTAAEWAARTRAEAARRHAPAALAQALLLAVLADPAARPGDGRLVEAEAIWDELGNPLGAAEVALASATLAGDARAAAAARTTLRGLGVRDSATRVAGPLAVLAGQQAAVSVRTLGSFAVFRDGAAVPASAWQSRKARDLVKILASRRGRSISRESLAGLLWPDEAADGVGNRLSVALSTARSVLDPTRSHPPDRYLAADRGALRLDVTTVDLDTEEFAERADAALAATDAGREDAVVLLEAAVAAYPGDFCQEDPYESWAEQPRDELRARHQQVLRTLAETLAASPRPDTAVPWLITLLGSDPYDEPTHLRLVRTLVRSGRHGEARRSYRAYTARMAEIDVEPAAFPQTRRAAV